MLEEQVCIIPALNCPISETVRCGLCTPEVREVKSCHRKSVLHVGHDRLLDRFSVSALILSHELPNLFILVIIDFIFHIFRLYNKNK